MSIYISREYGKEAKRQRIEGWKEICARHGKEGMKYAQGAMEQEPGKTEGFYFYGLSVGIYSDGVSILTALAEGLKKKTQNGFEKAYELDKMYDEAGPILALGRFWAVVPWPFKDKKKALKFYREYQRTQYFAKKDEGKVYLAELLLHLRRKENKADIIEDIRKNCGFTKSKSAELTESILEIIKHSLESGQKVLISGFGKFCVKEKKKRRGRNPATGEDLMLRSRRVVRFKCSSILRDKINRGGKS